jgi:lipoprotein-releasing system permease protein
MCSVNEYIYLAMLLTVAPLLAMGLSFLITKYALRFIMGLITGKLPAFIADRYLFSRQNRNAINIISFISVLGITYVTYVLIVVLSIFNGFQGYIEGMYTAFDPDVRVMAAKGKTMPLSDSLIEKLTAFEGVAAISPTVQDKAMLTYFDKQYMVEVKGILPDYKKVNRLDTLVYEGDFAFEGLQGEPQAVLGGSVAYFINARISDRTNPMKLWAVGDVKDLLKNPEEAVRSKNLFTAGYFKVQMEYDTRYIIADFALVQDLFDLKGKVTAYEIKLNKFDEAEATATKLRAMLGPDYKVETWFDMHQTLFKVMQNEKLVAYLILTLMLLIAAVNIIGGLSMIIVEKTRDIAILRSMGAQKKMIRRLFISEGVFVGAIGGIAGMISALVFSWFQVNVGVVCLNGGESFADIQYFPLEMYWGDYALTSLTVFGISVLAGILPSIKAANTNIVVSLRK